MTWDAWDKAYYRKQRDKSQWDALAREKAAGFLGELDQLRIEAPDAYGLLAINEADLRGIESFQTGVCEFHLFHLDL